MANPVESAQRTLLSRMRDAILQGELGPGQRLVEAELTVRFTATRGSIRQALVQLEGEGLVEREPNRGARVRSVSLEQAIEVTEARAALEGLCAAKAAMQATVKERKELRALGEKMREAVDAGDVLRYSEQSQELHRLVRVYARQHTVSELLDRLRYQSVRYHFSVALLPGRPKVGLAEHLEVIDAVVNGSPDEAHDIMHRHLLSVIDALREIAERPNVLPSLRVRDT